MLKIDKNTYTISEKNYNKQLTVKRQIIIGSSLRKDNNYIIHLQNKELGETKSWNTFTIDRKGKIFQHYDPKYWSNFIGVKKIDKQAISIILENMGGLIYIPDYGYINLLNEKCENEKNIQKKKWSGFEYWEKFQNKQINSLVNLLSFLVSKFKINPQLIEFPFFHQETIFYGGIVFKSNYINNSVDLNPFFDIEKIQDKLENKLVKLERQPN